MEKQTLRALEAIAVSDIILDLCDNASSDEVRLAALSNAALRMCRKLDVSIERFIERLRES